MERTSQFFAGSSHVLLRPLCSGGRYQLHEAECLRDGKARLVLLAPREMLADARRGDAWLNGARAATALAHPYLLRLTGAGLTDDGGAYAAYAMTEHRPARSVLERSGPLGIERACDVALCVLSALQLAHAAGILHGEVSIDTVLVATRADAAAAALLIGLGPCAALEGVPSPQYPPERLAGAPLTERGDIYSVALVLVSLLAPEATGREREWVEGADIPAALKDTLLSALDADPLARQPSARLLASELLGFAGNPDLFQLRLEVGLPQVIEVPQYRAAIHPDTIVRSERAGFSLSEEPARERLRAAVVPTAPTLPQVPLPHVQGSRPKPARTPMAARQELTVGTDHASSPPAPDVTDQPASALPTVLTRPRHWLRLRQLAVIVAVGFGAGLWFAWLSGLI